MTRASTSAAMTQLRCSTPFQFDLNSQVAAVQLPQWSWLPKPQKHPKLQKNANTNILCICCHSRLASKTAKTLQKLQLPRLQKYVHTNILCICCRRSFCTRASFRTLDPKWCLLWKVFIVACCWIDELLVSPFFKIVAITPLILFVSYVGDHLYWKCSSLSLIWQQLLSKIFYELFFVPLVSGSGYSKNCFFVSQVILCIVLRPPGFHDFCVFFWRSLFYVSFFRRQLYSMYRFFFSIISLVVGGRTPNSVFYVLRVDYNDLSTTSTSKNALHRLVEQPSGGPISGLWATLRSEVGRTCLCEAHPGSHVPRLWMHAVQICNKCECLEKTNWASHWALPFGSCCNKSSSLVVGLKRDASCFGSKMQQVCESMRDLCWEKTGDLGYFSVNVQMDFAAHPGWQIGTFVQLMYDILDQPPDSDIAWQPWNPGISSR